MDYTISLVVEENAFTSSSIQYKLISTNNDDNGEVAPSINELQQIETGPNMIILGSGYFEETEGNKTHTYNL